MHEDPYYSEIKDLETTYATKNISHMVNRIFSLERFLFRLSRALQNHPRILNQLQEIFLFRDIGSIIINSTIRTMDPFHKRFILTQERKH